MKTTTLTAPTDLAGIIEKGGSHSRHWLRYVLLLALISASVGAWLWWSARQQAQSEVPPYTTETIRRGDIKLTVTATGNLEPTNEVTVGSELSGTTQEVFVDVNDRVKKGQPLAKLDTSKLTQTTESSRASLNAARAKVNQAEATVRESAANVARLQELHKISGGKMPSRSEMDTAVAASDRAQADLDSAKASVQQSEAQLRSNETDLAKAVIKSPIDGIVLKRTVEPGQTVAASFTAPELFIIAENLEHMELNVAVAEADIGRVEQGQKATFNVDAWPDRSFTANVTRVSFGSAVVDNVVTYETELEVANTDLSLRPGMTAVADIHVAEGKGVLLVPNAALRFDPDAAPPPSASPFGGSGEKKSFVQSLMPGPPRGMGGRRSGGSSDKKPQAKPEHRESRVWVLRNGSPESIVVKTGLTDGRNTEVSGEGLTEGMEVITRANSTKPTS